MLSLLGEYGEKKPFSINFGLRKTHDITFAFPKNGIKERGPQTEYNKIEFLLAISAHNSALMPGEFLKNIRLIILSRNVGNLIELVRRSSTWHPGIVVKASSPHK